MPNPDEGRSREQRETRQWWRELLGRLPAADICGLPAVPFSRCMSAPALRSALLGDMCSVDLPGHGTLLHKAHGVPCLKTFLVGTGRVKRETATPCGPGIKEGW
jgi:hypothetical protein